MTRTIKLMLFFLIFEGWLKKNYLLHVNFREKLMVCLGNTKHLSSNIDGEKIVFLLLYMQMLVADTSSCRF